MEDKIKQHIVSLNNLSQKFEKRLMEAKTTQDEFCAMGVCNYLNFVAKDLEDILNNKPLTGFIHKH